MSRTRTKGKAKRRFSFRTFLGILLILVVLALDPLKNYLIKHGQTQNSIGNLTLEQVQANRNANVSYNWDDINTLDAYNVISQNVTPNDLPTIGGVAIPSVKMNLPIYLGVSDDNMY